ncbi:MAG: YgiQ family radical SAM protein, partial [Clostridiales bacterium]
MLLPINRHEMDLRDWHYLDFLLISGDAYVDHPSFGVAIISRYLENLGFRVGVLPQPDYHDKNSLLAMGRPRLGVLITSGNMDSLLNHYTAAKKPRKTDDYSPGGKRQRPDYATSVYGAWAREIFGDSMPIILGGIEASLRRFAHYDYWQDKLLPSVLVSAKADLLVYGMGELAIGQIADILQKGGTVEDCRHIFGLAYLTDGQMEVKGKEYLLPSYEEVCADRGAFARAFALMEAEQNFFDGRTLIQEQEDNIYAVINRPMRPLTTKELDAIYELPYERVWHPSYDTEGGVPAFDEVRFSL